METLLTRQNEDKNIDRLCAQKQIYIDAKKIFMVQVILTVPVTILLSLIKVILSFWLIDASAYIVVYGVSLTVIDLVLINLIINDQKRNAAKVQEAFDCSVYDLEWSKIFVGKKPSQELINKNSQRFKKSGRPISKLYDWYPIELVKHSPLKSILLCQKTNLNYDTSIRNLFKKRVLIVALGTLLILVLFALIQSYLLKDFLVQVLASFLPVFVLSLKIVVDQNKTIKSSEELRSNIEALLENESLLSLKEIRSIQDRIYLNRKDGGLIPEFIYDKLRDELEEEMHSNAANY